MISKLNVCGYEIKIKLCNLTTKDNKHVLFGDYNFMNNEIRINKDLTKEMQRKTLWHELFHFALFFIEHKKDNELLCTAFGNIIDDLLMNNLKSINKLYKGE